MEDSADLIVVGAGAAGLMAAIVCARHAADARVIVVDGARTIGAKILVSGGGRCNVTNRIVSDADFWGGSRRVVRRVLQAFPAARTVSFFDDLGVALHEEADGKLFPDTNRARTVVDALLQETARRRISVRTGYRVSSIERRDGRFSVASAEGAMTGRVLVLATGGRSLPKSGSDGFGYELAARLGHGLVPTTPALVPLRLDGDHHTGLSGISHPAAATVRVDSRVSERLRGSLLWTHFGVSGPVVLNASRHWLRARLEQRSVSVSLNLVPEQTVAALESLLLAQQPVRPRSTVASVLAPLLPGAVAAAVTRAAQIPPDLTLAHLGREQRRALLAAATEFPLPVNDSRGYTYAEATAGGIPLSEANPATMESGVCPGLFLAGEILDVDGRLGGFNFQWAWSSGYVAGRAAALRLGAGV